MNITHPSRIQNIIKWVAYISVILLAILTVIFLYWLYQPTNVLDFKERPIPIRTIRDHPADGGVVILHVNYCKNYPDTGRVRVSFVSASREVFLPASNDRQPPGCKDSELPILIPNDLPTDTYKVHFHIDYRINPLKHAVFDIDSKSFIVGT